VSILTGYSFLPPGPLIVFTVLFSSLKSRDNLDQRRWLGGHIVGYKGGQGLIGHPEVFTGVEHGLFLEVEAILAGKVAERSDRLCHHVHAR
jgi:hypothetical protein